MNARTILSVSALLAVAAPSLAAEPAVPAAPMAPAPPAPPARSVPPAGAPDAGPGERGELDRELAEARRRLEEASRDVARLSSQLGGRMTQRLQIEMAPRALLGVQVGQDEEGAKGARVIAVSPGGAAEQAGIKAGDLITGLDGEDLVRGGQPSRALVARARELAPEKPVKLKLLRDGKSREVTITPHAAPAFAWRGGPAGPGGPDGPGGPGGPDRFFRFDGPPGDIRAPVPPELRPFGGGDGPPWERGVPLAGLELATLSEGLGRYFGAKEGVLVVRAGNDDAWKLRDGDVILAIDGREPTSASHATRILRSYQRGEKLQMKVLRDHKTLTLDVTVPGG